MPSLVERDVCVRYVDGRRDDWDPTSRPNCKLFNHNAGTVGSDGTLVTLKGSKSSGSENSKLLIKVCPRARKHSRRDGPVAL